MQNIKPIEIIMLTHNRLDYLKRTIDTLVENTLYPYKIIIVDNASDIDTKQYLEELLQKKIVDKVFFNDENIFHYGWQIGIDATEGEVIALTDPDILVPKLESCWLTQMVGLMERYPSIDKLGVNLDLSNYPHNPLREKDKTIFSWINPVGAKPLSDNGEVYTHPVDTTLHIMKKTIYPDGKMQGQLGGGNAGMPRRYVEGTVEAVARDIVCYHLGWDDIKDYPDYFKTKLDNREVFRSSVEYWGILKGDSFFKYLRERITRSITYRLNKFFKK